jgi:hypothetical protein
MDMKSIYISGVIVGASAAAWGIQTAINLSNLPSPRHVYFEKCCDAFQLNEGIYKRHEIRDLLFLHCHVTASDKYPDPEDLNYTPYITATIGSITAIFAAAQLYRNYGHNVMGTAQLLVQKIVQLF